MNQNRGQSAKSSLAFLGAETVAGNGGLLVISVKPNSIADRSGLKAGDLIQAIDGKNPLTDSISEIRNLTVRRGMQAVTIRLGVR